MKKALKLVIILMLIFFNIIAKTPAKKGNAQNQYARVLSENTQFFANPDCTIAKFELPYGYFIRIIQTGETSTKISYMDDDDNVPKQIGYVKTSDLYLFDSLPSSPYLCLEISLKSDEILFADSKIQQPKSVLTQGTTARYYGEITHNGEQLCYVYANGFIGYVRKSGFTAFTIPPHEIPITEPNQPEQESSVAESGLVLNEHKQTATLTVDEPLKTVIVIAVCIICLSVVYLIFKPSISGLKTAASKDDDDFD